MSSNLKTFFNTSLKYLPIFLIFFVATSVSYLYAANWTNPPVNPPNNNTGEPINISNSTQIKTGNFTGNVIGANGFCLPPAVAPNASSTGGCISMWPSASSTSGGSVCLQPSVQVISTGPVYNGGTGSNGQAKANLATLTNPGTYTISGSGYWNAGNLGTGGGSIYEISPSNVKGQIFMTFSHGTGGGANTNWTIATTTFSEAAGGDFVQYTVSSSYLYGSIYLTYLPSPICGTLTPQ
jgi:hypothetical protein